MKPNLWQSRAGGVGPRRWVAAAACLAALWATSALARDPVAREAAPLPAGAVVSEPSRRGEHLHSPAAAAPMVVYDNTVSFGTR